MKARRPWGDSYERLAAILPPEAVEALIRAFPGERIRIPPQPRMTRSARGRRAVEVLQHASYREAARLLGVSPSKLVKDGKL